MEPPQRVLVVDDDRSHRSLLGAILRRISVDYDEAEDGGAAIGALRRRKYGAVILDLVMPGIDGIGVLNTLRAADPGMLSRIIVITGAGTDQVSRVPREVFKVMVKPYAPREVAHAVRDCLLQQSEAGTKSGGRA